MILSASRNAPRELDTDGLLRTLVLLHPLVIVGDPNSDAVWMSDQCSALCANEGEYLARPIADFLAALSDPSHRQKIRQSISCIDVDSMHAGDRIDSRADLGTRQGKPCKVNLVLFGTTTTSGLSSSIWILHFDDETATALAPAWVGDTAAQGAIFELCPDPVFAIDEDDHFSSRKVEFTRPGDATAWP